MAEELKERKAFEAHMRVGGHSNHDKHPDGSYVSSAMELWWQGWKARAQLPRQGGEAVAEYQQLSRYNNWDRIDKAAFDLGKLGSCPERFRALYTHPADQVAEPDADLVRQCIAQELATWEGDFKGPVHTAMRCLQVRIDAKLASLKGVEE